MICTNNTTIATTATISITIQPELNYNNIYISQTPKSASINLYFLTSTNHYHTYLITLLYVYQFIHLWIQFLSICNSMYLFEVAIWIGSKRGRMHMKPSRTTPQMQQVELSSRTSVYKPCRSSASRLPAWYLTRYFAFFGVYMCLSYLPCRSMSKHTFQPALSRLSNMRLKNIRIVVVKTMHLRKMYVFWNFMKFLRVTWRSKKKLHMTCWNTCMDFMSCRWLTAIQLLALLSLILLPMLWSLSDRRKNIRKYK